MRALLRTLAVGFAFVLRPSFVWAQAASTDRSEMNQWMKMTEHQVEPPVGTTITMANWRQYKSVMPLGMIKLFQGMYDWKMPADVQMHAAGQGFAGGTSLYTGDYLGDRKIITITDFTQDGADFPGGYDMPIAWPRPSWGKWVVRPMVINDVHRIPSEAAGYCYSSRIMYVDKELWHGMWVDLYDANRKLWKVISYYNDFHNHPPLGRTIDGVASVAYDLQNTHMTVWCGYANAGKLFPYIDNEAPKEYMNGVKCGSPSGLMQILR